MDQLPQNPLKTWLRSNRKRVGEFAQMVGRSEGTITRWCTGARHPRVLDQEKIRVATKNSVRPTDWHDYQVQLLASQAEAA